MCPHSDTFITFRSATDAQMEMSIQYAFTFFYPAPDRDNYLLDDTTESTLSFTVCKEGDRFVFDEHSDQYKDRPSDKIKLTYNRIYDTI